MLSFYQRKIKSNCQLLKSYYILLFALQEIKQKNDQIKIYI